MAYAPIPIDSAGFAAVSNYATPYTSDDLGTTGVCFKASAGVWYNVESTNGLTASAYLQVHNKASAPSAGEKPAWASAATVASGSTSTLNPGAQGLYLSAGVTVAWSTTQWTFTAGSASATPGVCKVAAR